MNISPKMPGENARMYARRIILNNIVSLELPPGSALSENELALTLKLSRTPVREALIEVSRMGLIEIIPQKGSFVTKINDALIEEAEFMRLSLENSALKLACKQGVSDFYLESFQKNLEEQQKYRALPVFRSAIIDLDDAFHKLLFESVGKQRIYDILGQQMVHFNRLRTLTYQKLPDAKSTQTVNDHENIFYALKKRDAELGEIVMTLHLTRHEIEIHELAASYPDYFDFSTPQP